jgi:hypothetical protein
LPLVPPGPAFAPATVEPAERIANPFQGIKAIGDLR